MSGREQALERALRAMMDVQSRRRHPLGQPDEGIAYDAAQAMATAEAAIALPAEQEPVPELQKATFKVHLQQYVERVTTIEVEASDHWEAIKAARAIADKEPTAPGAHAVWEDGDDAQKVEAYAVANAAGEIIWER